MIATPGRPLRIWLVARWPHDLRFIGPVVAALRSLGHSVEVSIGMANNRGGTEQSLLDYQGSGGGAPLDLPSPLALEEPGPLNRLVLTSRPLVSYAEQAPRWTEGLRMRWRWFLPRPFRGLIRVLERARLRRMIENRVVARVARLAEGAAPPVRGVVEQLRSIDPDIVVATPLIYPQAPELEALKAARSVGIPTASIVLSWDNLTSKGSFHVRPDWVIVWNDLQRDEAQRLHGFGGEHVVATGAPVFDYLLADQPRASRAAFLEKAEIPEERRYVLYAVSSRVLGLGGETELIAPLADSLRAQLGDAAPWILVRPHPRNFEAWGEYFHAGSQSGPEPPFRSPPKLARTFSTRCTMPTRSLVSTRACSLRQPHWAGPASR